MDILEVTDKNGWNAFVGSQKGSQFLQSWEWGEFQKAYGRRIWRIGAFVGSAQLAVALIVEQTLPLGRRYMYCPRGPIVAMKLPLYTYQRMFHHMLGEMVALGQREGAFFIRIEPPIEQYSEKVFRSIVDRYDCIRTRSVQPRDSLIIDLRKREYATQAQMHPKTRYNIRLAERKGVVIRLGNIEDLELFWRLNEETARRDGFSTHPKKYYQTLLESLPRQFIQLFIAEWNGKPLVANFVTYFGDTATYMHGASSDLDRNVMAPHLTQWRQMQEAKQRGYKYYDLWGLLPLKAPKGSEDTEHHSWEGLSRFKRGFGGTEVNYVGTYDLIVQPTWYKMYQLARRFR